MTMDERVGHPSIDRTLWYQHDGQRVTLRQAELLTRTESLVILGEAGMGKSHLLRRLAELPEYAFCTARQLVGRYNPRSLLGSATALVVDGLDEVSAGNEGDAVDQVLRKLGELGYPRFIMSCRVTDWRSATGAEAIREQYANPPTVFHLEPTSADDALAFLAASLGAARAAEVVRHLDLRGLGALLGNPQTLELISQVVAAGSFPESKGDLFQRATDLLRLERNPSKSERSPATVEALDAVGAAFAAMILTGNEAIVRSASSGTLDDDLPIQEIAKFPGGTFIGAMLDTRLFKALAPGRFGYLHRRIGEFLGAQWLAKQANSARTRRRLLKLFQGHGLVPSSLRGLHAWLATDPLLAISVIEADALGLIEYGDTDSLAPHEARRLLSCLRKVAEDNPLHYDWAYPSAPSLFRSNLLPIVREEITSSGAPFALRRYLIRSIAGSGAVRSLESDLHRIVLDTNEVYGIRSDAADSLVGHITDHDWQSTIWRLTAAGDDDSVRLGIEILGDVGCHVVDDRSIVELVLVAAVAEQKMLGVLYPLEVKLPDDRLEGVLDELSGAVQNLGEADGSHRGLEFLTDFFYRLFVRYIERGNLVVSMPRIWAWLAPFDASVGYRRDDRQVVHSWFAKNTESRRAIQRHVILDESRGSSVWHQVCKLGRRSSGLRLSPSDIAALIGAFDPNDHSDERWRELIMQAPLDDDVQVAVRPFLAARPELSDWMLEIANPSPEQWQLDDAERNRVWKEQRESRFASARSYYLQHIDEIRSGVPKFLVGPADAYMNRYSDLDQDLAPNARVAQWLGDDVARAVCEGFEAYILNQQHGQEAKDVGETLSRSKLRPIWMVTAAALAERTATGRGYADISDEQLLTGFCILLGLSVNAMARVHKLEESIEKELSDRGLYREAMVCLLEPQLAAGCKHVSGLYQLTGSNVDASVAVELALRWLKRFEDLPPSIEEQLLGTVVASSLIRELRDLVIVREQLLDKARARVWYAVGLMVDFERVADRLASSSIDPELLWKLRDLGETKRGTISDQVFGPLQIEWIVSRFRHQWPLAAFPAGGVTGDQNLWDASEYLSRLLRKLGGDHSDQAISALTHLKNAPVDGYTDLIRSIATEQARLRVEATYVPPSLDAIEAVVCDMPPKTMSDLQAVMLEELTIVQEKIKSDDAESWRGFFAESGTPYGEERCRDHLLGILRQVSPDIGFFPEVHVGGDKEVDITCSVGKMRLPIEIKGQWHKQLWEAADTQLDRLYTVDWLAERHGIYLVLWFGSKVEKSKRLISSGRGKPSPETPNDLFAALTSGSKAACEGRVSIVVLDLTRS